MATSLHCAKVLAFFVFVFVGATSNAQPENANWVIDGDIWIDFNSGAPIVNEEPLEFSTIEAAASVSDSLGNLLFYTNGVEVYNRLGEVISEIEIPIDDTSFYKSLTQGVLILPELGLSNVYRIIALGRYAMVDMSLNGGLGGMVSFPSWHHFESDTIGFAEKNIAIRHGNGQDWWILQLRLIRDYAADSYDSVFVSFLYDREGINKKQVSRINIRNLGESATVGEMAVSIKGDMVALAFINSILVYEFDRCSGEFGNEIAFIDSLAPIYSCSFSPSGRFVYFNTSSGWVSGNNVLYQLDLEKDQYGKNVLTEIYRRDNYGTFAKGQLELAPDGKLYMAVGCAIWDCDVFSPLNTHLSVVNFPDLPGDACDFDTLGLYLDGRKTWLALPNTVNYALGALEGSECDTLGGSTAVPVTATLPQWQITPTVSTGWYSFNGPERTMLIVYNVWGRIVWQGSATGQRIDLSDLPSGLYLVHAQWEQKQETFRILKQ